jgi:hypothetical protein
MRHAVGALVWLVASSCGPSWQLIGPTSADEGGTKSGYFTNPSAGRILGPAAEAEMERRASHIVSSGIDFEDGDTVITKKYDDGSRSVTKNTPWGKVCEFFPAKAPTTPAQQPATQAAAGKQ